MSDDRPTRLTSLARPCRAGIVGASGGIGAALVSALSEAGVPTHAFSRRPLEPRAGVKAAVLDLTDEAGIAAATSVLRDDPTPLRLVVVASGLLHDQTLGPERSIRDLDPDRLARSFAVNAIGPALVAKHWFPLLPRDGRAIVAMLSARVGSIADNRLGGWYGYRASKAALNQIVRTLAIELARSRPEAIAVGLHPGTVATALSEPFQGNVDPARLFTPAEAADHLLAVMDRLTPGDSGGFFAWDGSPIPF